MDERFGDVRKEVGYRDKSNVFYKKMGRSEVVYRTESKLHLHILTCFSHVSGDIFRPPVELLRNCSGNDIKRERKRNRERDNCT